MPELHTDEFGRRLNGGPVAQRSIEINKAVYENGAVPSEELIDEELHQDENTSSDREVRPDADS